MKLIEKTLFALCVVGLLTGATAHAWNHHLRAMQETRVVAEPKPQAEAPAPNGPRCVHEVCAQRPGHYRCVEWKGFAASAACSSFEVLYEHHCDCDRWEP